MLQVGRAGRFGTKGLAITFVASPQDSEVLNQVQVRARIALLIAWLPQLPCLVWCWQWRAAMS